ncbi:MAG: PBSX family phage terminase large subunit [Oscillospiraceae bacterium]|nr:PBSX family phage terminase large subunit [Oscillospiraceae bacterium]
MMDAGIPDSEDNNNTIKTLKDFGIPESDMNIKNAMIANTVKTAVEDGDIKTVKLIADFLRENREDKNEGSPCYNGIPAHLIGSAYTDIYRDIRVRRHRFYDFKGGRGSLKSSFCALVLVDEIMRNKNFCAIALRQVKDTLRSSVYAQITGAIDMLGLSEYFTCTTVSPMQITKNDTGQIIYFRGCDDPVKIKSIKPPNGTYIGAVWFEEKDQLKGSEAVRNIQQSVMRGGDDIIVLSSYNTPVSRRHFLNREETEISQTKSDRIIHKSSYLDAPPEWLGQPFLDEAEYLKNTNEKAYNHEYLGEAIGESGSVFENVTAKQFGIEEHKTVREFERSYYGVDWGFYPDPWAFVKCCYDSKNRALYIIDETSAVKKSNRETADILINEKGLQKDDLIICDSSEPKSIADYLNYGLYARGAEKGSISSKASNGGGGSVAYSMRWLQGLNRIVIDANKCPQTAKEFLEYEYERGADGEVLSGYPDRNNHFIDAVRYATNLLWRRKCE